MSDSTKRAIRTGIQTAIAVIPVVFAFAAALKDTGIESLSTIGGAIVIGATIVSKVVNAAEDAGLITPRLKPPSEPQ